MLGIKGYKLGIFQEVEIISTPLTILGKDKPFGAVNARAANGPGCHSIEVGSHHTSGPFGKISSSDMHKNRIATGDASEPIQKSTRSLKCRLKVLEGVTDSLKMVCCLPIPTKHDVPVGGFAVESIVNAVRISLLNDFDPEQMLDEPGGSRSIACELCSQNMHERAFNGKATGQWFNASKLAANAKTVEKK